MSASVKVVVLSNKFDAVIKAASGDQLKRAALAGGHVIEAQAKINANKVFSHKATNTLAGSIQTVVAQATDRSVEVDVGPTVVYGRIQELGGIIKPVHAKMLSWVEDGVRIFAKMVQIPARPYLRPAADEHKSEIEDAVGEQLKSGIERAL